ncbi:MAG TPA: hypothetical protein VGP92_14265 [Acidimicrobiia bacterium]|jgi:EAL domain-containing protein (putative c-di-GMP-specific phosphodiesterase class I)|nr:hypothetical protein [Acidimicrobiia bacterium]
MALIQVASEPVELTLSGEVRKALHRNGVPVALLPLDLSEAVVMANPARARLVLHDLLELGVKPRTAGRGHNDVDARGRAR